MCEMCDAYHQFEEREMPKTVTVEVELPEGVEPTEPIPRPRSVFDRMSGHVVVYTFDFPVRPIATEQTWALLNGIDAEWLTHDDENGFTAWRTERPIYPCNYEHWVGVNGSQWMRLVPAFLDCDFPSPSMRASLEPAARIWRIVERGEG